jgi:hypothetical protein
MSENEGMHEGQDNLIVRITDLQLNGSPMREFVVFAHPLPSSFKSALHALAVAKPR